MNRRSLKHPAPYLFGAGLLALSIWLTACNAAAAPAPALPSALPPTTAPTLLPTSMPLSPATPTVLTPPPPMVTFGPASFSYDQSIASAVTTTQVAGQNPTADTPAWAIYPTYDEYNFVGYPSKNTYHKPRIEIYPVAEYEQLNSGAKDIIQSLKQLLADKPASPDRLPLLPLFNAAQVFHSQLQYLAFQTGQGVRFVSQYDQAPLPINNLEIFYTFQGLTDDGRYYIAAILPVSTNRLPDSDQVTPAEQQPLADFEAYLKEVTQQLNGLSPHDFTPDLGLLDAMLQTLSVK